MRKIAVLAAAALMAGPMTAHALLINYGTAEGVTARTCIPGVTACDDLSGVIAETFGGFPGDATSSVTTTFAGFGTGTRAGRRAKPGRPHHFEDDGWVLRCRAYGPLTRHSLMS